jgi:uncharacterized protein YqgC (DUF456 family)
MFLAFSWLELGDGTLHVVIWTITVLLLLIGLVGTVVPMLPGPALIFAAAVFHALAMRYLAGVQDPGIGWVGCLILLLMVGVSFVLEMLSSAVGAKYFGSSKAGIWGAVLGGIIGLFFGLPGLIIGPIAGALLFERVLAKREWKPAAKSTWGALVGTGAGLVLKGGAGVVMVAYFFIDLFWLAW